MERWEPFFVYEPYSPTLHLSDPSDKGPEPRIPFGFTNKTKVDRGKRARTPKPKGKKKHG